MCDKDFEKVFQNLKTEFTDLHTKIEGIISKYEGLEKLLENEKKGSFFKCRKCKENFDSLKELLKHKKKKKSCVDDEFKCEKCDKSYKSENDLIIHKQTHGNFECDKCECKFDVTGELGKHKSAVHEKIKIFCHYYNNDKECPFESKCIFAHEDSPECRFGQHCERLMCMFTHDERDVSDNEDGDDSEDEPDDENDDENDDVDDTKNSESDYVFNVEDLEPSLKKVEDAMSKVEQLILTSKLKCDKCDFSAKNINGLNMHKKAKHTDNSLPASN